MRNITGIATAGLCALVLAACGGSDKPAYCSDVDNFKNAISDLRAVQPAQNGISSLTSAIDKAQSTGQTLVASAKSAFPSETSALSASLTAISATAKELGNPSTQAAAAKALPAEVVALKAAYDNMINATKDKCD